MKDRRLAILDLAGLKRSWGRLNYGLTRKVSLFVCTLLTLFIATFTTVNILAEQKVIEDRLKRRAQSVATMLADFASNYLTDLRIDELRIIVQDIQRREDILYAYVVDSEGSLIVDGEVGDDNLFDQVDDSLSREARASGTAILSLDATGLHLVEPVYLDYEKLGTVRLGMSIDQLRHDMAALRNRNLWLGAAFLAASLLVSLPLVRRITRPLELLTASTEAASQGRFEQRIRIQSNDEIGTLEAAFNRMLAQLEHHNEQIRHLAYFDSITELPNRVYFKELLSRAILSARRYGRRGAVLYLDLDRFKLINDTFGHEAGDRLLQGFAQRLSRCLRESDVVARLGDAPTTTIARLGGDEFTVLLPEIEAAEDPARVADRILKLLEQPFDLGDQSVVVGSSIGIALFPDDGDEPDSLLKNADTAMYHAKERGRNNVQLYRERLGARNLKRITLERELRSALESDQLLVHFQPLVDLRNWRVVGFEALLRWQHPRLGLVMPGLFIPLAEETRLILSIGEWAIRAACLQAKSWAAAGLGSLRVSVNLSVSHLQQESFVERLADALAASGAPPELLELEITESMVMVDPEATAAKLDAIRELGVMLAIDDFGTGHSSLSYLKRFPLNRLKIDRSFISDIGTDRDDGAIVSAIIAMAHNLRVQVVAEGVETVKQLEFLRLRQCDLIQGFLVSPPLQAKDVAPWLRDWQRQLEARGEPLVVAGSGPIPDPAAGFAARIPGAPAQTVRLRSLVG
ncbi:MAG: diguanylate cyclase/phosphodiesterase with and sensor(s) [Geminicoccaceae bacterium]|nr:diguanylate cyclase/phosphodiesterase with and sensor(s) [Geminicoccaceae bacterium]